MKKTKGRETLEGSFMLSFEKMGGIYIWKIRRCVVMLTCWHDQYELTCRHDQYERKFHIFCLSISW